MAAGACGHSSGLAATNGERLRMTAEYLLRRESGTRLAMFRHCEERRRSNPVLAWSFWIASLRPQ
jgi:hypothetical protein